ncbi:MAG: sodium:solute symporter family protein [Ruminococcaceae bacterium]|nr:sodium:solute symporter family protein [Oscillospiraceae bacterium]
MSIGTLFWILTFMICAIFLVISWRVRDASQQSFSHYAIGGASFSMVMIFFTQFASIMGAGNFIGHAGSGYENGVSWLAFIAGEQGAKLVFALTFAGFAGSMRYYTLPGMIDDLITRDKVTRILAGVLSASIMVAWVGGQGKAFGEIFRVFTGINPIPVIFLFSAIFIIYTCMGGIYSVVYTDLVQGILCLIFGTLFYVFSFSKVNYSLAELGSRLSAVGREELWSFSSLDTGALINRFLTGLVGILVAQIYWQRCFSCKTRQIARRGLFYSGIIAAVMTMLTAFVGLIVMTMNQELDANTAMPWFMMNCVPQVIAAGIFVLILAAGMSSADSCLNSAAVLVVNDVIRPIFPERTDARLIRDAKRWTVIIGVISSVCAIYASTIISLFSKAYAMAGSGLVPLLVIGLLWKERGDEKHIMQKRNSRVTPWGARCGIVVGAVCSQVSAFGDSATIIGLLASAVTVVVVSLLTRHVSIPERMVSPGFIETDDA